MANTTLIPHSLQKQEAYGGDKSSLANKDLHLSIELREHSLLASLLDKDTNQYLAVSAYNFNNTTQSLNSILEEDLLNQKCSGVSVVFTHNSAMLMPAAFFSRESVKDYLTQQNLIRYEEIPCSDFIKNNDCFSVYAVSHTQYDILKQKYPQAVFRHHSSIFVEYLLALYKAHHKNGVHVYLFSGYMDVVALQAGKLLLYNRYPIKTPYDFTYFLLWAYEELKLKHQDSPCTLYGETEEKSEMFKLASKYLKNVLLAEKPGLFTFSPMLENIPWHRYYSLFMQYLCI